MRPIRLVETLAQSLAHSLAQRVPIATGSRAHLTLGVDVDARLGAGMTAAGLHDLYAQAPDDAAAAAAFALLLTLVAASAGPTVWIRPRRAERVAGMLYAEGIVELGGDPDALLLVMPDDDRDVLRAADDGVRHAGSGGSGGAGAVIVELHGRAPLYDLTASRRLALAARARGVLVLMLRVGGVPVASAAETRWSIAAAPALPLATDAPGHPAFDLTLLRHRGGLPGFQTRLELNRDTRSFSSLSGRASAAAVGGTDVRARAA